MSRHLTWFFFLVWAAFPSAAAPSIDCKAPKSPPESTYCAEQAFMKADEEMNGVYQALLKQLSASHAELLRDAPATKVANPADRLKQAQRAWIAFRDKHCEMVMSAYLGGTGQGFGLTNCLAQTTTERVTTLKLLQDGP